MTDQDPEDPLPGLFAEIDQMLALAPQIARIARVYYVAFQAEGFTDEQAVYLTVCQVHQKPGPPPR